MTIDTQYLIKEIKSLIAYGGLPCLTFLISLLIGYVLFPTNIMTQLSFAAGFVVVACIFSIGSLIKKIWSVLMR
jgi:hypothetical protein